MNRPTREKLAEIIYARHPAMVRQQLGGWYAYTLGDAKAYDRIEAEEAYADADAIIAAFSIQEYDKRDSVVFDILDALKPAYPDIAGGYARATGGVDLTYILEVIRGTTQKEPS